MTFVVFFCKPLVSKEFWINLKMKKKKKKMSSQRECVYFSITVVDVQQLRYSESNISTGISVSPKVKLYFFTLKFLSVWSVVSFTGQKQLQNGTKKMKEEGRRESEGCKSRRQCHVKTQKLPSNFTFCKCLSTLDRR